MSDAKRVIESSIVTGLSERAHLTGQRATTAHIIVPDLMAAIFHPGVRWSVKEYLEELEAKEGDGDAREL